jgi:hypothetical protein
MRTHVEKSKNFELDKVLIKQIYNRKDKKQKIYKISKKNVVYDKQITENYNKYSNNNRSNYFSSYQSFRDYISSGYNYDFLVNEINNIKSLLGYSHNIRELVNKKMNPEKPKYKNTLNHPKINQIIELNEESNSSEDLFMRLNNPSQNKMKQTKEKRTSTVFQIDKENPYSQRVAEYSQYGAFNHKGNRGQNENFIQNCKLLKLKEEEIKRPQNQYQFRLFSVLSEDFDPFFLPMYDNFMKVKNENQKTKLIKVYNQEKAFIECVTLIKSKLKSHLNKEKNKENENKENININGNNNNQRDSSFKRKESIPKSFPQYIFQLKIPYINAFYFGRTESYFKDIDNFMSMYKENTSLATKRQEIDFFTNLYKMLTFNNSDCKRFLQYLYSNSYFFKYIYNIFTVQNKITGNTIKNFAPSIKKYNEEEHFLNDFMKQLFSTEEPKAKVAEEEKNKNENNQKSIILNDDFIESLLGSEFIYKINLCEEDVSDYINNKKTNSLKELLSNNKNFNQNYIISLNNENLLNIFNTKKYQKQKKKTN